MGKSVLERCDKVIGEKADDFMAIGSYKKSPEDTENQYLYGIHFSYPDFDKIGLADRDKLFKNN